MGRQTDTQVWVCCFGSFMTSVPMGFKQSAKLNEQDRFKSLS